MTAKFLFLLLGLSISNVFAGIKLDETVQIKEYVNTQQSTVVLPTNFGQPFIVDKSDLKSLKEKEVYHIDLVYTSFRSSEDFDQNALNERRISQLRKYLPEVDDDQVSWTIYEQTGAIDKETAKSYFHGFVIHYTDPMNYESQKEFFEGKGVPFAIAGIDNQVGGFVEYGSGTIIEMQKNIVQYKNGDVVQGYYELHYREFRNQADIALSGIPMMFYGHGKDEVFNSVGMYEIRAYQNGKELELNAPAIVNFQTTEALDDVAFFSMDKKGNWTKEALIRNFPTWPDKDSVIDSYWMVKGPNDYDKIRFQPYIPKEDIAQGNFTGFTRVKITQEEDRNELLFTLEPDQMRKLVWYEMSNRNSPVYDMIGEFDTMGTRSGVRVFAKDSVAFIEMITGRKIGDLRRYTEGSHSVNEQDFTVWTTDKGLRDSVLVSVKKPYIPKSVGLVQGLKSRTFGVYNCDQTKRIEQPMAWKPTYYNKATGEKLEDLYVTYVIDLKLNAALSYGPNFIYTSKNSKSRLIVFDTDERIYFYKGSPLKSKYGVSNMVDVEMVEITQYVNNSADLKKIIDQSKS